MKNKNGRIPSEPAKLNAYMNNTTAYLFAPSPVPPVGAPDTGGAGGIPSIAATPAPTLNWQRLGLLESEASQWRNYTAQANVLYDSYSDKEEKRTVAIKNKLVNLGKAFAVFARKIINRMSGMPTVTEDDAAEFNFVLIRKQPVHPEAPIKDAPIFGMFSLGGSEIAFKVRPFHDTKRASKMEGAEIEMRYQILLIDEPTPKHIDDLTKIFLSSKADFVFHCGTQNTGYYLWVAMRWIVVNDPSRNGPWTRIQSIAINL